MNKSTVAEIRARFDADVERFSDLSTGQVAVADALVHMDVLTAAAAAVHPGASRVLDVGCGAGNYTLKLLGHLAAERGPGVAGELEVTLLDLSEPMLERAEQRLRAAGVGAVVKMQADVREAGFAEGRFDIALAAQCLHHLRTPEQWRAVYTKLWRALAFGGGLWVSDSVAFRSPAVQALALRRWGVHLEAVGGPGYRDDVLAYYEQEDSPAPLTEQLALMADIGFVDLDVLHATGQSASFGGRRPGG